MRRAFVEGLADLADADDRIVLLTGDLGFSVVEGFARRHPKRFINVGVAEQNMVGVATGLAEAGFLPFTYSIATFSALRPFEFIRNGPVLHDLPVRIVGIGGGFEYGTAGYTHHAIDDLAVLRTLPRLIVLAPADPAQARAALLATWSRPEPIYYRLGKDEETLVPGLDGSFELGSLTKVRDGTDLAIIATGAIAAEAVAAATLLEGLSAEIHIAATISPIARRGLIDILSRHQTIATVEGHSEVGGLGSLVLEVAASRGLPNRVVVCGIPPAKAFRNGGERHLNASVGLTADRIAARIRKSMRALH